MRKRRQQAAAQPERPAGPVVSIVSGPLPREAARGLYVFKAVKWVPRLGNVWGATERIGVDGPEVGDPPRNGTYTWVAHVWRDGGWLRVGEFHTMHNEPFTVAQAAWNVLHGDGYPR